MRNIFGLIFAIFVLFAMPDLSHASSPWEKPEDIEYGLPKGAEITHDLKAVDQHGKAVDFSKMSGENGMVLYFVRSAEWCRYCVQQLIELSRKGSIIEDTGYNIAVVSHDSQNKLARFSDDYDFPYPLISDPQSEIIMAFGLLNTEYLKGTAYHGIPYPAIYIIGYDGLILEKFFHIDFKIRPDISEIRQALDRIGDYESILRKTKGRVERTGLNK